MPDLPKLDRIDINILVQLQKDGAVSNLLLAEQVGLSPSPCLQRVKRLEKAAYITGYGARINLAKLTEQALIAARTENRNIESVSVKGRRTFQAASPAFIDQRTTRHNPAAIIRHNADGNTETRTLLPCSSRTKMNFACCQYRSDRFCSPIGGERPRPFRAHRFAGERRVRRRFNGDPGPPIPTFTSGCDLTSMGLLTGQRCSRIIHDACSSLSGAPHAPRWLPAQSVFYDGY
jgi:DNA-binding Lrp family transcriptional regulator